MILSRILLISLIVSSLLISTTAFSEDAVLINKNDKAPFTGVLLDTKKAQEYKNTTVERDNLKDLNLSLSTSLNLQTDLIQRKDTQLKLVLDQNDKLSQSVEKSRDTSELEKIVWFGLGIIISGISVYAYSKINK
jgi:hypothetical protein